MALANGVKYATPVKATPKTLEPKPTITPKFLAAKAATPPQTKTEEPVSQVKLIQLVTHEAAVQKGVSPTPAPKPPTPAPEADDDPPDELGDTWRELAPYLVDGGSRTLQANERWAAATLKGPKPPPGVIEYIQGAIHQAAWPANVILGVRAALLVVRKGIPYVWGGTDPNRGLDCSGYARYVLGVAGDKTLHRTTYEQASQGRLVKPDERQPLDLCFFEPGQAGPGHVAIYLAEGWAVHEPHTGLDAQWLNLAAWTPLYTHRYLKDIPGHESSTPTPAPPPVKPHQPTGANAAWRELTKFMAQEVPALGEHARRVGNRLPKTVS